MAECAGTVGNGVVQDAPWAWSHSLVSPSGIRPPPLGKADEGDGDEVLGRRLLLWGDAGDTAEVDGFGGVIGNRRNRLHLLGCGSRSGDRTMPMTGIACRVNVRTGSHHAEHRDRGHRHRRQSSRAAQGRALSDRHRGTRRRHLRRFAERAYQQEHQIAESLERALLPATVSSVDGARFAVRYLAATDGVSVGGDWYDVMPFTDVAILVAAVSAVSEPVETD